MVDISRILASRDIAELKAAVAVAFEDLSLEQTNSEKIADLDARLKIVEVKPA